MESRFHTKDILTEKLSLHLQCKLARTNAKKKNYCHLFILMTDDYKKNIISVLIKLSISPEHLFILSFVNKRLIFKVQHKKNNQRVKE